MKKVNRWFCKNLWNHASFHDRISTYLSRFSLTLKIGHLAYTQNKMSARTNLETQTLNVALTTFFNFCLLGGILSQIKPWKLIANFHPFTLCIACLYRIIYASDHHNHLQLTWNESVFHEKCHSFKYQSFMDDSDDANDNSLRLNSSTHKKEYVWCFVVLINCQMVFWIIRKCI